MAAKNQIQLAHEVQQVQLPPDSWSPFGEGGLNGYSYCEGDPVNQSDPTGHVSFFKGFLNFLGLRKPRATATLAPETIRPSSNLRPESTTQSRSNEQSTPRLPAYSGELEGRDLREPRLPNYEEDNLIKSNVERFVRLEETKAKISTGQLLPELRKADKKMAIDLLNEEIAEIRKVQYGILFENPRQPASRATTADQQRRNRHVLGRLINENSRR
ncbi:hypothetical protein [Pseudomonas sp. GM55]|uniref:hypothetical protein n=1 Tax=Pseudomonas sp. GM55 TaxID=1144333 RepID=UPI000270C6BC|nr:hypothetical protein PMI31_05039 [Pseudomonas sp. GM55]